MKGNTRYFDQEVEIAMFHLRVKIYEVVMLRKKEKGTVWLPC